MDGTLHTQPDGTLEQAEAVVDALEAILEELARSDRYACGEAFDYALGTLGDLQSNLIREWQEERLRRPVGTGYRKRKIAPALRQAVFERDGHRCRFCGSMEYLTCDHILAESRGGPTELGNLQTLCRSCNSRKGVS